MLSIKKAMIALTVLCSYFASIPLPSLAGGVKDADWLVTVQSEELKGMLNFNGSLHKDPVKVHVTYLDTEKSEDSTVNYEDFWYNSKGDLLGQEKHTKYDIRPAEQIIVRIKHKKNPAQQKEFHAVADAALRFYLDSCLHQGKVSAFRVPLDSFNDVEQAFEKLDYSPYAVVPEEVPGVSHVVLYLASEPDGQATYLQYNK